MSFKIVIQEEIKKKLTHPYHAHVNFSYEHVGGDDTPFLTGSGKTRAASRMSALNTHRLFAHGSGAKHYDGTPLDKDDPDDVEAWNNTKHDLHYRVSEKAHAYIHDTSKHPDITGTRGREDGYEFHHENMPELHFDHDKRTISHKSEV